MSVALVILHAKRMRRVILSSVACPALPYFATLTFLSATFLILRRNQRDIKVYRSSCKVPVILVRF